MKNYIVLDIENPNTRGNSICAIAVIVVQDYEVVDKKYTLINPEDRFDTINSRITGIDSSKILNAPTLQEYWVEIKDLFTDNIVIGHNVNYDLSVLSKSLNRYNIDVPVFNYCCTLKLSQKFMNLESYKLENIAKELNIDYIPHNALEDALASQMLFEYLIKNFNISNISANEYNFLFSTNDDLDEKLSSNINELYGIVKGINYDGIINQFEINLLQKWVDNNSKYKQYSLFNRIITNLSEILEDNYISDYEKIELENMITHIASSKIYNESTLGMQVLKGIMRGVSCDEKVAQEEVEKIKIWLDKNNYLSGIYPYDKILLIVNNILEDGILTDQEKEILAQTFEEVLDPVYSTNTKINVLDFKDKTFCLTGEFKSGSKEEIKQKVEALGANEKSGVSSKLDYLLVGGIGSDAWKYGNVGGKIAKAQEIQEKGAKVRIISEDDLLECLKVLVK